MKILALVFLFGFAAAVSYEDLERARDEAILSFIEGMEKAPSLQEAMGMDLAEIAEFDEETKSNLVKALRNAFDDILNHIKQAIDHGKEVKEDMLEHAKKIKEELKNLHEDITNNAKQLLERLKEKAKGKFREWLEKLGWKNKESEYAVASDESKRTLRDILLDVRKKLQEKTGDLKKLGEEINKLLKENALLAKFKLQEFTEETMEKLKRLVSRLLGNKDNRSIKDLYEKVREYLKDVSDDFEQHYSKFLDWLEKVYKSGAEAAKGRIENVKKVARKFLDHVKEVGKKTADEALEFFRPYKKDLGTLWEELKKSIKEAYGEH